MWNANARHHKFKWVWSFSKNVKSFILWDFRLTSHTHTHTNEYVPLYARLYVILCIILATRYIICPMDNNATKLPHTTVTNPLSAKANTEPHRTIQTFGSQWHRTYTIHIHKCTHSLRLQSPLSRMWNNSVTVFRLTSNVVCVRFFGHSICRYAAVRIATTAYTEHSLANTHTHTHTYRRFHRNESAKGNEPVYSSSLMPRH